MKEVIDVSNSYQSMKAGELILKHREPAWDPNKIREVRWYHGATGTGKTRSAFEEFPDAWVSGKSLKWFEGYDAHKVVIVDDFRKDFCTFHELLRICDRYPFRVETKGGSRQFVAEVVIFTCPFTPEVLYRNSPTVKSEDLGQLTRRISEIRLFGDEPVVPEDPSDVIVDDQGARVRSFRRGQ